MGMYKHRIQKELSIKYFHRTNFIKRYNDIYI